MHGQAVVAWNPYKQRTPLFRLTSSWPILAEQELKRIKLTILGDMRPDGTPAPTELVWDGGGLPEPAPKTAKPAGAKAKGASVPK